MIVDSFNYVTALFCLGGWISHWLINWGVCYKTEKKGLIDYIDDDPPAFYFSIVATLVVYFMGPSLFALAGINLPVAFDDPSVKGVISFLTGYNADSILRKIVKLFPSNP